MDTNPSKCLFDTKGISYPNTYTTLSRSVKCYIVYTDASDNACGAQLSQEHDKTEFPVAFLSHTFMDTQQKWSTTNKKLTVCIMQSQNGTITSRELVIVCNDHKPLARFLYGKNANNKINRWGLELATYNITFEWISGACNKSANCLS